MWKDNKKYFLRICGKVNKIIHKSQQYSVEKKVVKSQILQGLNKLSTLSTSPTTATTTKILKYIKKELIRKTA